MSNIQKYDISVNGQYPYEKYVITPILNSGSPIQTGVPYTCNNSIRYQKRISNEIVNYLDLTVFQKYFYSTGTSYTLFNASNTNYSGITNNINDIISIEDSSKITFNDNSTLFFDVSALRKDYKSLPEINFFAIQTDISTGESYGYILYPNKLFLKPTAQISKGSGTWTVTTKIFTFTYTFKAYSLNPNEQTTIGKLISNDHEKYLKGTDSLPSTDIAYLANSVVKLSLSASNTYVNSPNPTITNNSTYSYSKLLNDKFKIDPDSTFVTFSANYLASNNSYIGAGQVLFDEYASEKLSDFLPTFILRSTPTTQKFQLLQRDINNSVVLSDTTNTIAEVDIDLGSTYYQYSANSSYIQTIPSYNIGFSYIENGPIFKNNGVYVDTTLNTLNVGTTAYNNFGSVPVPDLIGQNITWTTTKPPHHYSYNAELYDLGDVYNDRFSLNFYLSSFINQNGNTATIDTKIISDYALISYGFDLLDNDENIRYYVTNFQNYGLINAYYYQGGTKINYDLQTSPWVSAKNAKTLIIEFESTAYQSDLTFRASLSTSSGNLDEFNGQHITFSGQSYTQPTSPIILDIIQEKSNYISIDSTLNKNSDNWPYIDLTDSLISWYYEPSDLNLTINSIDGNGNALYELQPHDALTWNSSTWNIAVSGYGPNTVKIYLSSQKYDQTAYVKSTSGLFDYFSENQFVITQVSLDNINPTRTIILSAGIPFGDTIFQIPTGIPLNWYWQFDEITDPTQQPISAFYYDAVNSNYIDVYGEVSTSGVYYGYDNFSTSTVVSSILLNIQPPTNHYPQLRKITAIVSSNIRYPAITGSYTFYLDDYPNNDLFSGDYKIYYTAYTTNPLDVIGDTRLGLDVITRPNDSDANFTFVPNNDILPNVQVSDPTDILWTVIDDLNGANSTQYDPTNPLAVEYSPAPSYINVTFNILSGIAPGWTNPHNLSVSSFFFFIDTVEFYKPFEFINYPQFAWLDSPYLTLLTPIISSDGTIQYTDDTLPSYYTNSGYPSAYANKKSGTQPFWLSANKDYFQVYYYQNFVSENITTATSAFQLIELPYSNSDVGNYVGLFMTLTAYDNMYYPEKMGTTFLLSDGTGNGLLATRFNITTRSLSSNEQSDKDAFHYAPYILPYNDLSVNFTLSSDVNLDLDFNKDIIITQNISAIPDNNAPALIVGGSITYVLSSTFWTVSSDIPPTSGDFIPFNLSIGDPYIPLTTGDLGVATLSIYTIPNILQQIPSSTFDLISLEDYQGDRDLWNIV
jgi:hypothetical protein